MGRGIRRCKGPTLGPGSTQYWSEWSLSGTLGSAKEFIRDTGNSPSSLMCAERLVGQQSPKAQQSDLKISNRRVISQSLPVTACRGLMSDLSYKRRNARLECQRSRTQPCSQEPVKERPRGQIFVGKHAPAVSSGPAGQIFSLRGNQRRLKGPDRLTRRKNWTLMTSCGTLRSLKATNGFHDARRRTRMVAYIALDRKVWLKKTHTLCLRPIRSFIAIGCEAG